MNEVIELSSDEETSTPSTPTGMSNASTKNTTTQEQKKKQRRPSQRCQTSQPKLRETKNSNLNTTNKNLLSQMDFDFLDHVIMVWLHRVRKGYRKIEMPEYILKAKAKEAASLLKLDSKFCENSWLKPFQEKMKKIWTENRTMEIGDCSVFRIEEIIKAEKYNFYSNYKKNNIDNEEERLKRLKEIENKQQNQLSKMLEEQKKHLEEVKEKQRKQMERMEYARKQREEEMKYKSDLQKIGKYIDTPPPATATKIRFGVLRKPSEDSNEMEVDRVVTQKRPLTGSEQTVTLCEEIDVGDVLDQPIKSYDEALDCLALVENYLLSTRNLKAVMFVNQIENFIKQHVNSMSVG